MVKQYLLSLVFLISTGLSQADPLQTTRDWADASATAKRNHTPILVVFESEECGFCERLKQEILEPLADTCTLQPPLIRQFDIYSGGKITDFDGDPIRSRQFKDRYHIYAVPTLLILDPDGKPLSDPIVGYNSQEEYRELLRSSLIASYQALD